MITSTTVGPNSSSWLNLVEHCFAEQTNRKLLRSTHCIAEPRRRPPVDQILDTAAA